MWQSHSGTGKIGRDNIVYIEQMCAINKKKKRTMKTRKVDEEKNKEVSREQDREKKKIRKERIIDK